MQLCSHARKQKQAQQKQLRGVVIDDENVVKAARPSMIATARRFYVLGARTLISTDSASQRLEMIMHSYFKLSEVLFFPGTNTVVPYIQSYCDRGILVATTTF